MAHLTAFHDSQLPEDLHKVRVQVKKIRALLKLSRIDFNSLELKPLKKLYCHVGKVRDVYIRLNFIARNGLKNQRSIKYRHTLLERESDKFCKKINAHLKDTKSVYEVIPGLLTNIPEKYILHFYKKQLKKVATALVQQVNPDEIHMGRKKIKNLIYVYETLPKPLAKKLRLSIAYLEELQDVIGKWHDSFINAKLFFKSRAKGSKLLLTPEAESHELFDRFIIIAQDFERKTEVEKSSGN